MNDKAVDCLSVAIHFMDCAFDLADEDLNDRPDLAMEVVGDALHLVCAAYYSLKEDRPLDDESLRMIVREKEFRAMRQVATDLQLRASKVEPGRS